MEGSGLITRSSWFSHTSRRRQAGGHLDVATQSLSQSLMILVGSLSVVLLPVTLGHSAPRKQITATAKHGTLIIVSATNSSIVIAADSGMIDEASQKLKKGRAVKIFPVSNSGACFLIGDVALSMPHANGAADYVDFLSIVRSYTRSHQTGSIRDAFEGMDGQILQAFRQFQRRSGFSRDPTHSIVALGCAGYMMGEPTAFNTDFHTPTDHEVTEHRIPELQLPIGYIGPPGRNEVAKEIIGNANSVHFAAARNSPPISKYWNAVRSHDLRGLTTDDMLQISLKCLEATESPEGRIFAPDDAIVIPPNYFAVISGGKEGRFTWAHPH